MKKNKRSKVAKKVKRKVVKSKKIPIKKKIGLVPPSHSHLGQVHDVVLKPEEPKGPEPFDVEDWMIDQGLKRGIWQVFSRENYDKEFCEVRCRSGVVVGPCWPSNGQFVRLDKEIVVAEGDVSHIRYFKLQYEISHENDRWGRVGDEQEGTDGSGA